MALFARSRTREVELERRVGALQNALNQCKGVAQQWWSFRASFTIGVVVVARGSGLAVGVCRDTIGQPFLTTAVVVGVAKAPGDGAAEADAAFQKGHYA